MGFKGMKFVFNGIPCERYDLMIATIGNSKDSSACGTISEIIKDKTNRQNEYSAYGVSHSDPLKIDITFFSKEFIDRQKFGAIQKWLEVPYYAKLQVIQDDLQDSYYNCIFTRIEAEYFGSNIIGITATAECNAAWSYSDTKVVLLNNLIDKNKITFFNPTDDYSYVYPIITIKTETNGNIIIKNTSDKNRTLEIKDLRANDEFIIDNDLQIIKTVNGLEVFPKCNHQWLRLVPGQNIWKVEGSLKELKIEYTVPQKRSNN